VYKNERERERESESEREWWRQLIFKGDRLETHTAFSFMKERDIYYIYIIVPCIISVAGRRNSVTVHHPPVSPTEKPHSCPLDKLNTPKEIYI